MIELKLRNILRQVKSENPQKRYEALDQLFQHKQDEGLEVQIDVLKDVIKTASSKFPEPVDKWDNPSFYLIDFVCDFPMPEVVEALIKHFDGFDVQAKERTIEFLLSTEDEEIFYFLEEKIVELVQREEFVIPTGELSSYPVLVKDILDKTIEKISSPHYKFMIYDLLLSLNTSGLEKGYRKDVVLPSIQEDYLKTKEDYLKFDVDYQTKYVYSSWKDRYFSLRSRMRLFINLMEYYFSEETAKDVTEAISFKDPFIRTEALLVCMVKGLPYDKNIVIETAENIETAEMVYWELKDKNLEHLYPLKEAKQQILSKTRLFSMITNLTEEDENSIHFPENIKIIDHVDTENAYGQPVRYYMMSFEELDRTYLGWAGGYALEDGEDTAHLWDGTYTDFIELNSASLDQHKQAFFMKREAEQQEHENSIYYESSPSLSKGMWFFYALLISHWIRGAMSGFEGSILPSIFFTVVGISLTIYEIRKNKTRKIALVGHQLIMTEGAKQQSIALHEIKKVEYNKKHVHVYRKSNDLAFKFPLKWVRHYEQFYVYMKEHTDHLKDRPFIQP